MAKLRSVPITTRLFLLAFVLRLVPVLFSIDLPIGLTDMFQYDMLARSILSGNGYRWYAQPDLELLRHEYPEFKFTDFDVVMKDYDARGIATTFRAPGYPAFLALVYGLTGLQWRIFAARFANAVLGATLAPMSYVLTRRLFPEKEGAARFAGAALAIYPLLVIFPLAIATENLFIPLTLAGLLTLLRAAQSGRGRDYLLAGAILGAAALTRSVIFLFAGLAVFWIWFAARHRRGALLYLLALLVLVVPWSVRNSLVEGRFTFVENSLGYNLHMGYHPQGTGTFQYGISLELVPYLDDGVRNELGTQAGLQFIREDPGRVPYLMLRKLGYFFGLERRAVTYFYSNNFFGHIPSLPLLGLFLLFNLPFTFLCTLAVIPLPFIRFNSQRVLLLLLFGSYLLPHILIMAEERFHLAILPGLAALAGYAWTMRAELWAAAKANRVKLILALILVGLLWLNWGMELWRDAEKLAILFGPDGNHAGFPY